MSEQWLWVVGGGFVQTLAIEAAKRRGLKVIVSDRNAMAPGCIMADLALPLDTYDEQAHVTAAKGWSTVHKIVGVMTYGADVGPTVSALAEALDLPAASYQAAVDARDKISMRIGAFNGLNRRHPAYLVVGAKDYPETIDRLWIKEAKFDFLAYPCVLKPANNCGGRGVAVIKDLKDWKPALKLVGQYNNHRSHLDKQGDNLLLVEEFMGNTRQFGVDYYVEGEQLHVAMMYDRVFSEKEVGLELGAAYPFDVPEEAHTIARGMAITLGIKHGPLKIDFWDHPKYGLCVAECATRQSGGYDQYTYPLATGAQPVEVALDVALGLPVDPQKLQIKLPLYGAHAAGIYKPGKIQGWRGLEQALALPGALRVFARTETEISALHANADRPLFTAALGTTRALALQTAKTMAERIAPIYG